MRKGIFSLAIAVAIMTGSTSCSLFKPAAKQGAAHNSTYRVVDVQTPPVSADLQIDQTKKTASVTDKSSASLETLKATVLQKILETEHADVLIQPSYVVDNDGTNVTVTVSGYVARYVNLKQAKEGDAQLKVVHPGVPETQPAAAGQQQGKKKILGIF